MYKHTVTPNKSAVPPRIWLEWISSRLRKLMHMYIPSCEEVSWQQEEQPDMPDDEQQDMEDKPAGQWTTKIDSSVENVCKGIQQWPHWKYKLLCILLNEKSTASWSTLKRTGCWVYTYMYITLLQCSYHKTEMKCTTLFGVAHNSWHLFESLHDLCEMKDLVLCMSGCSHICCMYKKHIK